MNRIVPVLLVIAGALGALLLVRSIATKYAAIGTALVAVWNDPEVKKIRRRAATKLKKARKSAQKNARKAEKAARKAVNA